MRTVSESLAEWMRRGEWSGNEIKRTLKEKKKSKSVSDKASLPTVHPVQLLSLSGWQSAVDCPAV